MKEVFDLIKERLEEESKFAVSLLNGKTDRYVAGVCDTNKKAIQIVSEVEAEFGKDINVRGNGWIPCSERLPEDSGRYMTTNMYEGEKKEVFDLWYEDGKWFIDAGEDETIRIVLAWMPLPKPYIPEKGAQE